MAFIETNKYAWQMLYPLFAKHSIAHRFVKWIGKRNAYELNTGVGDSMNELINIKV